MTKSLFIYLLIFYVMNFFIVPWLIYFGKIQILKNEMKRVGLRKEVNKYRFQFYKSELAAILSPYTDLLKKFEKTSNLFYRCFLIFGVALFFLTMISIILSVLNLI